MIYLILLLILSYGPGKDACKPGFDEYITITLLDKAGMPIPNAEVYVTFVIDGAVNPPRTITSLNITNMGGKAGFRLFNNQQYYANLDCSVKVEIKLYNQTVYKNNRLISLKDIYPNYQIDLDLPKIKIFFVLDNNDMVTVDKLILFGNYEYNNVYMFESYVPREIWGTVSFRNLVREFNYTIRDNKTIYFLFSPVKYYISTFDDKNQPLRCKAQLNNVEYEINGPTEISIWDSIVKGQIKCSNKVQDVLLTEKNNKLEYWFDVTPPIISDFRVERVEKDYVILGVNVFDPNQYATGVKEVLFYLNGELIRPSYVSGSYYYRIPNQDASLKIVAIDKANNAREIEAQYKRIEDTEIKKEEVKKKDDDPISWFVLLIGVGLLLGIAIYIYNMYKSVKEE